MSRPKTSGFTIVRNGQLLDYPFQESVKSVLPLVDEFVISVGESEDSTEQIAQELKEAFPEKVRIIHSAWAVQDQKEGFQLRHQTDLAMKECQYEWCFYIQADEVVHEEDYEKIRQAQELVDKDPNIDGVLFDYLHFYGDFNHLIRGRDWYRREVRLFKNNRGIQAFRDAQGFRRNGRRLTAIYSAARVFHYGYVRSVESLRLKSGEMARWWGEIPKDSDLLPKHHVGLRQFSKSHPAVMAKRIETKKGLFDPSSGKRPWNLKELKDVLTLVWEFLFSGRLGEFRNYDRVR